MDALQQLQELEPYMAVEDDDSAALAPAQRACPVELPVHMAALPGGKRVPILKTVLTSACERNCYYCAFRAGRDFRRHTFKPEQMAEAFHTLWQAGVVEGLFLSSGVAGGGVRTQDQLLDTAAILREKYAFRGYLHLKLMPGAQEAQVERALQLADRLSVNLEAPTSAALARLAPQKILMEELLAPLKRVEQLRTSLSPSFGWNQHMPSSTTQFVVTPDGASDSDLLRASEHLIRRLRLTRVYYARFSPVQDTPLENNPPENPWRVHRLYQASFLLRDYGFQAEDFPLTPSGALPLDTDPKQAWALRHLAQSPLELNRADYLQLLRVPGIGPQRAQALITARRRHRLVQPEDLRALGIPIERAAPFILLAGRRPTHQPRLFW